MGIFNKLKNMFTEEYEEEKKEPIKKEMFQVEIPAPKIEKKEEVVEEPKKEDKFVFPVYFDESDLEPAAEPVKKPQPVINQPIKTRQQPQKAPEPKKTFKPSPVISPVYGVLDKNYKKDDIVSKPRTTRVDYFSYKGGNDAMVVEDIRKKAFGTLEDELENTLSKIEINNDGQIEQTVSTRVKHELEKEAVEEKEELEGMFFDNDMTLEEAMSKYESKLDDEEVTKLAKKDDLIESDLFNLIDSMYDKDNTEEEEE